MGLLERFRSSGRAVADGSVDTSEREARRLIDEGNVLEQQGRMEEAMQRYEAAIRMAPKLARAHLNRGNVLQERGDVEGALAAVRAGLRERCERSPIRHPEVIAAGLESALRTMWQRWCAGLPAQTFEVLARS